MNDLIICGIAILGLGTCFLAMGIAKKISIQKKQQMLKKYTELRKESLALQGTVSDYMLAKDAARKTIDGNQSLSDFYRQLKSNHIYNLSDKYLSKVKNSNNPIFLNKAERNLQEQEEKIKTAKHLIYALAL